jgi:uncharacterized protein YcfJ
MIERTGFKISVAAAVMGGLTLSMPESVFANPLDQIQRTVRQVERTIERTVREQQISPEAAIIGGVVGGVVGSQLFDDNIVGVAVGVAAGAFIANEISRSLSESEQQRVSRSTVSTVVTGENSDWEDPDTGTRGSARVVETFEREEPVSVQVYRDRVAEVPPLEFIGETYRVTTNSNVRGGPSTDFEKVGFFTAGTLVNVVGKVEGEEWYFVSENGIGSGFVYAPLLEAQSASIIGEQPEAPTGQDVYEAEVADTRLCRTIEQSVTAADGTTTTELLTACRGPNGWEVAEPVAG